MAESPPQLVMGWTTKRKVAPPAPAGQGPSSSSGGGLIEKLDKDLLKRVMNCLVHPRSIFMAPRMRRMWGSISKAALGRLREAYPSAHEFVPTGQHSLATQATARRPSLGRALAPENTNLIGSGVEWSGVESSGAEWSLPSRGSALHCPGRAVVRRGRDPPSPRVGDRL